MEIKKSENLVQLAGRVPESLKDAFWNTVPDGVKNQHVMSAAVRLWVSLPSEYRKILIDAESGARQGNAAPFDQVLREIFRSEYRKTTQKKS